MSVWDNLFDSVNNSSGVIVAVLFDVNCVRASMTRQNCYRGDCMEIVMSKSSLKGDGLTAHNWQK